jgi:hypothetical protein
VQSDFVPIPGSKIGELAARFDIVLGETPGEGEFAAGGPPTATRRWEGRPATPLVIAAASQ